MHLWVSVYNPTPIKSDWSREISLNEQEASHHKKGSIGNCYAILADLSWWGVGVVSPVETSPHEGIRGGIDEQRLPGPAGNCSPQQSHGLCKISRYG